MFTWSVFVTTTILGAQPPSTGPVTPPPRPRAVEDSLSVQDILGWFRPTTFVIDREGIIRFEYRGKAALTAPRWTGSSRRLMVSRGGRISTGNADHSPCRTH
jgi:hypothetical protein